MNCNTKAHILRAMVVVTMMILVGMVAYEKHQTKKIIEKNSQIINSIAAANYTQAQNTNILLDILAIIDNTRIYTTSIDGGIIDLQDAAEKPFDLSDDQPVELPNTLSQALYDLNEIDHCIRSLAVGNIYQRDSLNYIRERIRQMDDDQNIKIYEARYPEDRWPTDESINNFEWQYVNGQ